MIDFYFNKIELFIYIYIIWRLLNNQLLYFTLREYFLHVIVYIKIITKNILCGYICQ